MKKFLTALLFLLMTGPVMAAPSLGGQGQLTITGTTSPHASDFFVELTSNNNGFIKQNDYIDYEIKYGSNLSYSTSKSLVLVAEWTKGTPEKSGAPDVNLVDYVFGSATLGYGGVEPVIDSVNNQISWTIKGIPSKLNSQVVHFKLKTNSNYKNLENVRFKVIARSVFQGISSLDKETNHIYQYVAPKNEENKKNMSLILKPTPVLKKPASLPLLVDKVIVNTIDKDSSQILVNLSQDVNSLKVKLGKNLSNLDEEINITANNGVASLDLNELEPATTYFFKIENSNESYAFKTAEVSEKPKIDLGSLMITSQNNIVMSSVEESTNKTVVLPQNQNYAIRVVLVQPLPAGENKPDADILVIIGNK